jgi:hypothetical protein
VQGDEYLYQHLRSDLISVLSGNDDYQHAKNIVLHELSETLPCEADPVYDIDWTYGIEPVCRKIEAELMRLAVARRIDPFDPGADFMFATADRSIAEVNEVMTKAHREFAEKHGLTMAGMVEKRESQPADGNSQLLRRDRQREQRRKGRTPVALSYDVAQQVWWDLADDLLPQKPTQQDLCDRLTSLGLPMSPRTLRVRIGAWRRHGLIWEPPRPKN